MTETCAVFSRLGGVGSVWPAFWCRLEFSERWCRTAARWLQGTGRGPKGGPVLSGAGTCSALPQCHAGTKTLNFRFSFCKRKLKMFNSKMRLKVGCFPVWTQKKKDILESVCRIPMITSAKEEQRMIASCKKVSENSFCSGHCRYVQCFFL